MLVIHPKDRTTAVLRLLYEGLGVRTASRNYSNREMGHLLHHTPAGERIMLLGHGSEKGLFYREDDTKSEFDKIIVGHPQGYLLRRHGGNIIGIWCHAVDFARREGLHGLFSGMIVSEQDEAAEYGIATDRESMDYANRTMFTLLRTLLDRAVPLHEIPGCLKAMDNIRSELSRFNYKSFYCL